MRSSRMSDPRLIWTAIRGQLCLCLQHRLGHGDQARAALSRLDAQCAAGGEGLCPIIAAFEP